MRAIFTFGINKGYGEEIGRRTLNEEAVAEMLHVAAAIAEKKSGMYISTVVSTTRTIYKPEWGCPVGGEATCTATAVQNPTYNPDGEVWKTAVLDFARVVKEQFAQSTLTIEFIESEVVYLN